MEDTTMSEEKKNVVTEEGKEARELTNEELEQVTDGRAPGIITMSGFAESGAESGISLASALRPR